MLVAIPSGHHVMAGPAGRAATPSVDVSTALAPYTTAIPSVIPSPSADQVPGLLALIEVFGMYALVVIAVTTYGAVITQRLETFDDLQSCQAAAQAQVATQQLLHTANVHWRCEPTR